MRYLMVTHKWFVDSKGFSVQELNADNLEHAKLKAAKHQIEIDSIFSHARCDVIEIGDNEHLAPKKLTMWERLSGQLSYDQSPALAATTAQGEKA
jgi:hypothetical protein